MINIIIFFFKKKVTFLTPRFRYFGVGLMFSRGGALAIIVLTVINILAVSRDFCTFMRNTKIGQKLYDFLGIKI